MAPLSTFPMATLLLLLLNRCCAWKIHHTARPTSTRGRHYEALYTTQTPIDTDLAVPLATAAIAPMAKDPLLYPEYETPLELRMQFESLSSSRTTLNSKRQQPDEQVLLISKTAESKSLASAPTSEPQQPESDSTLQADRVYTQVPNPSTETAALEEVPTLAATGSWRSAGDVVQTQGGAQFALFGAIFAGTLLLA